MKMKQAINVYELTNPKTGKTWLQENAELKHNIPIGTLVELIDDNSGVHQRNGVRLYVVAHDRDCDMTPLYSMSADKKDTVRQRAGFANSTWVHGWPEEALIVVESGNLMPNDDTEAK
jgi:hypothetical protein